MSDPKYISFALAREITGHETDKALVRFIENHNQRNPSALILRIPKRVEKNSLVAALALLARRHTPFYRVQDGLKARALRQGAANPRN